MKNYSEELEQEYRESMYETAREAFLLGDDVVINGKKQRSLLDFIGEDYSIISSMISSNENKSAKNKELSSDLYKRLLKGYEDLQVNEIKLTKSYNELQKHIANDDYRSALIVALKIKKHYEQTFNTDLISESDVKQYYWILDAIVKFREILDKQKAKNI